MSVYNTSRFVNGILKSHENSPPSFTVRLYREHWTLNNGSKFLYNNQTASLLDDIRTRHIPVDFLQLFDAARLPFYEGCLIVELLDYRPTRSTDPELEQPESSRVVLTPNDESRWADICLMNQKTGLSWTDAEAVELEARLLMTTAPPLCLEPNLHLTRMVNATQRATTPPAPPSLKRKASVLDQEADEVEKARRVKITQFMNPRLRSTVPTYRILDAIQKAKLAREKEKEKERTAPTPLVPNVQPAPPTTASPRTQPNAAAQPAPAPAPTPTPVPVPNQYQRPPNASSPAPSAAGTPPTALQDPKKQAKRNSVAGQSPMIPRASVTPAPTAPSGAPLPIPPHMQQHFQAQVAQRTATPSPAQAASSPRPPHQGVAHASSPTAAPEQRPPSAVPSPVAQVTGQPTPAQVQQIQQAAAAAARAQPSPAPGQTQQQQAMHSAYMAQNALPTRRGKAPAVAQAAAGANGQAAGGAPQTPQMQNYMQQQRFYAYLQVQQQQRLSQGQGQAATSAARAQTPAAQLQAGAGQVARGSPMVANQPLASRSPMPNPAQQPSQMTQAQAQAQAQVQAKAQALAHAQQQQQQQPHPQQTAQQAQQAQQPQQAAQAQGQHAQHPQQPQQQFHHQQQQIAYAQYVQQMAAMQAQTHAQQHPQMQQHLAAAAAARQSGQQQQQQQQAQQAAAAAAMQNPQMMPFYNYARMPSVAVGQIPAQYWQQLGAGRGIAMPGMPGAHPQHMQQPGAGAAKPAQGGQQGS